MRWRTGLHIGWVVALGAASAAKADESAADLAFIEFLGSFSDEDGEWLDPMALEEALLSASEPDDDAERVADDVADDEVKAQ